MRHRCWLVDAAVCFPSFLLSCRLSCCRWCRSLLGGWLLAAKRCGKWLATSLVGRSVAVVTDRREEEGREAKEGRSTTRHRTARGPRPRSFRSRSTGHRSAVHTGGTGSCAVSRLMAKGQRGGHAGRPRTGPAISAPPQLASLRVQCAQSVARLLSSLRSTHRRPLRCKLAPVPLFPDARSEQTGAQSE